MCQLTATASLPTWEKDTVLEHGRQSQAAAVSPAFDFAKCLLSSFYSLPPIALLPRSVFYKTRFSVSFLMMGIAGHELSLQVLASPP